MRIVHNITRDTFRANDILACLGCGKKIDVWQTLEDTGNLITELMTFRKSPVAATYETITSFKDDYMYSVDGNDSKSTISLPGVYVHKILINIVAMWVSPRYTHIR